MSNRPDSELSATARQIIADAGGFDEPTADDRERVRTRWLASIAVGAGLTSLTGGARAATVASWGLKSAGLALALVAGVGGLYLLYGQAKPQLGASQLGAGPDRALLSVPSQQVPSQQVPSQQVPSQQVPSQHSLPAAGTAAALPERVASPVHAGGQVDPAPAPTTPSGSTTGDSELLGGGALGKTARGGPRASAPAPGSAPPRHELRTRAVAAAASAAQPSAPGGHLGEEIALLSRIRSSVQEGAHAQALALLNEYEHAFERPALGMEAQALRVDALCQSGQRDGARGQALAFEATWPESPLLERVRTACP